MNRRQALLFVGAAILIGIVLGTFWLRRGNDEEPASLGNDSTPITAATVGSVTLYFPGADGKLHSEVRGLDTDAAGAELAQRIVDSVLKGPDTEGLFSPLPASTTVGSVLLSEDGTLYLDLTSSEHPLPPVPGSQRELLAAYSLVNSICSNVPRIAGVVLLWNSEQRSTFAGNLDTTRALRPNRRLVSPTS